MPISKKNADLSLSDVPRAIKIGNLLIVDKDQSFIQSVAPYLEQVGFNVHSASDAITVQALLKQMRVDIALVNVNLFNPDDSGDYSGIHLASNQLSLIPCIMIAETPDVDMVREALATKINGSAPAYDFVSKDQNFTRILTIINTVLNLADDKADNKIITPEKLAVRDRIWHPGSSNRFKLNLNTGIAVVDDKEVDLSAREYQIMLYLIDHPVMLFTREDIVTKIFHEVYEETRDRNRINNVISRIRGKIEPDTEHSQFIVTSWGKGWLFFPDGKVPDIFK